MKKIIITITDTQKTDFYDLEVPTDVIFEKLKKDIVDTLNGYIGGLHLEAERVAFISNRTGKQLSENDTLEEAGVWNGDYITVVEV